MRALPLPTTALCFLLFACRLGYDDSEALLSELDASVDAPSLPTIHVLEIEIADTLDDGEIALGALAPWYPFGEPQDNDTAFAGHWNGEPIWLYLRFRLPVAFTVGTTVSDARLLLLGRDAEPWEAAEDSLRIAVEDAATAPEVAGEDARPDGPNGRTLLVENVRWPATGGLDWQLAAFNESPNLAGLVETLIARHDGLAAGSYIQFWLWADDVGRNYEVGTEDLSSEPGDPDPAKFSLTATVP